MYYRGTSLINEMYYMGYLAHLERPGRTFLLSTAGSLVTVRKEQQLLHLSSSSSLLLSSLELSDTKSKSLKYEPSSEPLHISAKHSLLN